MKKLNLKTLALISIILLGIVNTTSYIQQEISFSEYSSYERKIERAYLNDEISQEAYQEMMDFLTSVGYEDIQEFNEDLKSYKSMYR